MFQLFPLGIQTKYQGITNSAYLRKQFRFFFQYITIEVSVCGNVNHGIHHGEYYQHCNGSCSGIKKGYAVFKM